MYLLRYGGGAVAAAVAVAILVAVVDYDILGRQPLVEVSDLALNAIQITRAKSLHELYGNYSRWWFNHPGPVFFYCYAGGEILLYDVAHLVASPHAAHLLAGVFVQSFFLAVGIQLMARAVSLRWFLPIAVLAAVFYLSLFVGAGYSIWPPHVMLGPLFALIVCCTIISMGDARPAPLAALAGVFLCHGHVAQPLFVVPLSIMAIALYWLSQRREGAVVAARRDAPYLWAAGIVILVGLVPIAYDAAKLSNSNLALIIEHLRKHSGDPSNPWSLSVAYLLSFVVFQKEGFFVPSFDSAEKYVSLGDLLATHSIPYIAVGVVLVLTAVLIVPREFKGKPFTIRLIGFLVGVVALTLIWARKQNGEMYEFNSHFFYGVILLIYMVPIIVISSFLQNYRIAPVVAIVCLAAGVTYFAPRQYTAHRVGGYAVSSTLANDIIALLRQNGVSAVRLEIDETEKWITAATVANILHRAGIPFFVAPTSAIWFSHRYIETPAEADLPVLAVGPAGSGITVPGPSKPSASAIRLKPR